MSRAQVGRPLLFTFTRSRPFASPVKTVPPIVVVPVKRLRSNVLPAPSTARLSSCEEDVQLVAGAPNPQNHWDMGSQPSCLPLQLSSANVEQLSGWGSCCPRQATLPNRSHPTVPP